MLQERRQHWKVARLALKEFLHVLKERKGNTKHPATVAAAATLLHDLKRSEEDVRPSERPTSLAVAISRAVGALLAKSAAARIRRVLIALDRKIAAQKRSRRKPKPKGKR